MSCIRRCFRGYRCRLAAGVTPLEGAEYGPVPTPLIAATRKKYVVPFLSPVAVHDVVVEYVGQPAALLYVPPTLVASCT